MSSHRARGRCGPSTISRSTSSMRSSASTPSAADTCAVGGLGAAGAVGPRHEMIAAQTGLAHHVLEGDVGGAGHRDVERAAGGAVGIARGIQQHREIGALHHLGLVALVEHRKARRHIGLERKLLQQPGAQRVDGLHLQPARRFQRAGEQFARAHPQASRRAARCPTSRIAASSAASSSVTQWPSVVNTRSAMLAAAALVKVMQRIFSGGTPSSSSRITRCTSTWVLPEPALAETKAEAAGSDARACVARTASGMSGAAPSPFLDPQPAGRRPFLDAREIVVAAVAVRPHRQIERGVGLVLVLECADQRLRACCRASSAASSGSCGVSLLLIFSSSGFCSPGGLLPLSRT